jgi:hypothetical protein
VILDKLKGDRTALTAVTGLVLFSVGNAFFGLTRM